MADQHLIAQQVDVRPLDADMRLDFSSGIDGRVDNSGTQHFVENEPRFYEKKYLQYHFTTAQSDNELEI